MSNIIKISYNVRLAYVELKDAIYLVKLNAFCNLKTTIKFLLKHYIS